MYSEFKRKLIYYNAYKGIHIIIHYVYGKKDGKY